MSGQTKQSQALPDAKVAYDHLFDNVHTRVFFGKLAKRGYEPRNEKQAEELLLLAGRLRGVEEAEKAAEDQSPFGVALAALDDALGQNGMDGHLKRAQAQDQQLAIKQAAASLAADPMIYNSILSLKAAEAAAIANQL